MFNSAKIFTVVITLIIVFEVIVISIMLGSYISNSKKVMNSSNNQRKIISILFRDLNIEYLTKKFRLIIEDELLVAQLLDNTFKPENQQVISDTIQHVTNIDSSVKMESSIPWFVDLSEDRFKGFYVGQNKYMNNLLQVQYFLYNLFKNKYASWKNSLYGIINFVHITFYNSKDDTENFTYYKFPIDTVNDQNYNPIGRPFFNNMLNEEHGSISITPPYKFQSKEYGNDICIRREKEQENEQEAYKFIICFAFNFYDYYIFKSQIYNILKDEQSSIYIVYVDNGVPKVVFNSNYYQNELVCKRFNDNVGGSDSGSDMDYYCDEIDFFNVYFKSQLDALNNALTKGTSNPLQHKQHYIKEYNNIYTEYNNTILSQLRKIFTENPASLLDITIDNFEDFSDTKFSFTTRLDITLNLNKHKTISDITFTTNHKGQSTNFFVFPILQNFDYDTTEGNLFQLKPPSNPKYPYYLITVESGNSLHSSNQNFKVFIITELSLYLIFITVFDIVLYVSILKIYNYICNGLLLPLKLIVKFYLSIGKASLVQNVNAKDTLTVLTKSKHRNALKDKNCHSFLHKLNNCKKCSTSVISNIFRLHEYPDIKDALTSLRAINLIISYNDRILKGVIMNNTNVKYNDMTTFAEAIDYLMERFYRCENDVEELELKLLQLLIEKMFVSVIKEKNNEVTNIEKFYLKITAALKRTKNEFYVLIRKSESNIKANRKHSNSIDMKQLRTLDELEHNLVYYFYIYKALLIEKERNYNEECYENKVLMSYSPDDVEDKCLRMLRQNEEMHNKLNAYPKSNSKKSTTPATINEHNVQSKQLFHQHETFTEYTDHIRENEIFSLTETLEHFLTKNRITTSSYVVSTPKQTNEIFSHSNSTSNYNSNNSVSFTNNNISLYSSHDVITDSNYLSKRNTFPNERTLKMISILLDRKSVV